MMRHKIGNLKSNDLHNFCFFTCIRKFVYCRSPKKPYSASIVTIHVLLSFAVSHATYLATIFPDLTSAPPTFLSKTCNPLASIAAPARIN